MSTTKLITRLLASRPGTDISSPADAAAYRLRMMAKTYRDHQDRVDALDTSMHTLLNAHYPRLMAVYGAGTVSAAELAVTAGGQPCTEPQ